MVSLSARDFDYTLLYARCQQSSMVHIGQSSGALLVLSEVTATSTAMPTAADGGAVMTVHFHRYCPGDRADPLGRR